jgi:hypothetical protein
MASASMLSCRLKVGRARRTAHQEVLRSPGNPATLSRGRGT